MSVCLLVPVLQAVLYRPPPASSAHSPFLTPADLCAHSCLYLWVCWCVLLSMALRTEEELVVESGRSEGGSEGGRLLSQQGGRSSEVHMVSNVRLFEVKVLVEPESFNHSQMAIR